MLFAPGLIVKEFASRAIMPPSARSKMCFAFRVSHDKTVKLSVFMGSAPEISCVLLFLGTTRTKTRHKFAANFPKTKDILLLYDQKQKILYQNDS